MNQTIRVVLTGDATQLANVLNQAATSVNSFAQQAQRAATTTASSGAKAQQAATGFNQLGTSTRNASSGLRGFASIAGMASNVIDAFAQQGSFFGGMAAGAKQLAYEMATVMPVILGVRVAMMALQQGTSYLIDTFVEFDKQMVESTAIMGNLDSGQLESMEKGVRELAKSTTFSAGEIAEGLYFIASAGYDASSALQVLPVATKFAQAGMMDMDKATEVLLDSTAAMGLVIRDTYGNIMVNDTVKNITMMSDIITKAAVDSNATIDQIAEAMTGKAGPAARMMGKDVEELTAVIETYANVGIKGSVASTQISMMWRDMQTRAIKNSDAFREMNIRVFDANGNMRNTADILADMSAAMSGLSDEEKRMALLQLGFQDRSIAATLAVIDQSKEMRNFERSLRDAGGTTEEVAQKQLGSLANQMTLLGHRIGDFAIEVGRSMQKLSDWIGETIAPAMVALGKLFGNVWDEAQPIIKLLAGGIGLAFAGALKGLIAVLTPVINLLANNSGLITAALIAWSVAIARNSTAFLWMKIVAMDAWNNIQIGAKTAQAAVQMFGTTYQYEMYESTAATGVLSGAQARLSAAITATKEASMVAGAGITKSLGSILAALDPITVGLTAGLMIWQGWQGTMDKAKQSADQFGQNIDFTDQTQTSRELNRIWEEMQKNASEFEMGDGWSLGRDLDQLEAFGEWVNPFDSNETLDAMANVNELADKFFEVQKKAKDAQANVDKFAQETGKSSSFVRQAFKDLQLDPTQVISPEDSLAVIDRVQSIEGAFNTLPPASREAASSFEDGAEDIISKADELSKAVTKNFVDMADPMKAFSEIDLKMPTLEDAYKTVTDENEKLLKEQQKQAEKASKANIDALNDQRDAAIKANEDRIDAIQSGNDKLTDADKDAIDSLKKQNDEIKDSYDARIDAANDAADAQKDAMDGMDANKPSLQQWADAMTESNDKFREFNNGLEDLARQGANPALLEAIRSLGPEEGMSVLNQFFSDSVKGTKGWVQEMNATVAQAGQIDVFAQWKAEMDKRTQDLGQMRENMLALASNAAIDPTILQEIAKEKDAPQILAELRKKVDAGDTQGAVSILNQFESLQEGSQQMMDDGFQSLMTWTHQIATGQTEAAAATIKEMNDENVMKLLEEGGLSEQYVAQLSSAILTQFDALDDEAKKRISKWFGYNLEDSIADAPPGFRNAEPPAKANPLQDAPPGFRNLATGGILKFANGGESHIAQIAMGQNPVRVWAEPETGGEAYIPLGSSKRDRSTAILGTVADMFGYTLVKKMNFAMGGLSYAGSGVRAAAPMTQPASGATREIITVPIQTKNETNFNGPIQGVKMEDAMAYKQRMERQKRLVRG